MDDHDASIDEIVEENTSRKPTKVVSGKVVTIPTPTTTPTSPPTNVIDTQPGVPGTVFSWLPASTSISDSPGGLEYLEKINKLFIKQRESDLEIITGWQVKNQYDILDSAGHELFFALEESNVIMRQIVNKYHGYTIHIMDISNREVMRVTRPFKGCTCLRCCADCDCCGSESTIEAPPGNMLGFVRQRAGYCSNNFVIRDQRDDIDILRIEGPNMWSYDYYCKCDADKVFEVSKVQDGEVIGSVSKKFRGWAQETRTDKDLFCVQFPRDLDLRLKALLVGATFLIDFLQFEEGRNGSTN